MSGGGVMLSGWLRKSPPERKLGSRHYSWKKRWFVLKSGRLTGDPNVLEYSKYQTSKKPIKSINLIDCTQIDINVDVPIRTDKKDTASHYIFAIVTNSRTFYLVADSIREMSTWVHCLCDLCGFCHDSNDKSDLSNEKQTFRAGQPTATPPMGNGRTNATSTLLPAGSDSPPVPMPRPEKTLHGLSKPTEPHHESNGTVNSSFVPSQNGYDVSEENVPFREGGYISGQASLMKDSYRGPSTFPPPDIPVYSPPPEDNDSNGYLHLADCETATNEPDTSFLTVEKCDERRSSTDSVFAHDDGSGDSKDDDSPALPIVIQPTSRFLQAHKARLSSMPDCPPPPPPVNVSPYCGDEDEDDVVEARTRNKRTLSRPGNNRLPPIDDSGLYNVPPGLQHWKESNSSYGSSFAGYSGHQLSPPEYINTQDSKSSGSFSSTSHQSPLGPGMFSNLGSMPTSSGLFGHQLYDVPSPMSPVFPLQSSTQQLYQSPRQLERNALNQSIEQKLSPTENSVKNKLRNVTLLDVGNVVHRSDQNSVGLQDTHTINITSDLTTNKNSVYSVPPARPPKPGDPPQSPNSLKFDSVYDCPRSTTQSVPQPYIGIKTESLYDSPRSRSAGSVGSVDHSSTYDTVRAQTSPLSPPHATVIGTIPDAHVMQNKPTYNVTGNPGYRNAISATNSPLATPDLPRRIEIIKTASFNSKLSPLVQQNKTVSGSAPSLYDVPQPLTKSPGDFYVKKEIRSSQSSSTSGENPAVDGNSLYDMPRKFSNIQIQPPPQQQQGIHSKIDDATFPGYEKMASQDQDISDEAVEDSNPYTIMTGYSSVPSMGAFTSQVPPAHLPLHTKLGSDFRAKSSPPPVHRDLKPGRRSLGSDDGSTQGGHDRKKNSRDSCESDEAVSPPHTTILHTMPIVSEPKMIHYGAGFSPVGSRNGSMTSPQHSKIGQGVDFVNRLSVSPNPPQRPPKSTTSISSLSPRSPPVSMQLNQQPGRPYTPTQAMHKSPQVIQDRHFTTQLPSSDVPERPPKPANMRYQTTANTRDSSRQIPRRPPKIEEHGFAPSRPPKPSVTPSSGDSLLSSGSSLSGTFFPHGPSFYGPSSVVPPPPSESHDREIKYIEISTPGNPKLYPPDIGHDSRSNLNESVEYMQLDPDKTRALERSKKERLQQRANSDAHSISKGKDKSDSHSIRGKD